MKVMITGAGGSLGRMLAPALAELGHEAVLLDYREIDTPYRFIRADITCLQDVLQAAEGADVIVHAAALHGIHLSKFSLQDYWKLNMEGTFNVYTAAKQCGVAKVLLCSTMGVYGDGIPESPDSFAAVTEDLPLMPGNIYGFSKKQCEEWARFFSQTAGIRTIAYRLGMFGPQNFMHYGFRLLKGGVDVRDVVQAFLLGLGNEDILFDAFNIMAELPFRSDEEFREYRADSEEMIERLYPGIAERVAQRGEQIRDQLHMRQYRYWSIEKAKRLLGYQPIYDFSRFSQALLEGKETADPNWGIPRWGLG